MTLGGVYKFKVDYCILTKGIYGPLSAPTYNHFKNLNCQVIDIFRKQVRQLHHSINLKMSLSEKKLMKVLWSCQGEQFCLSYTPFRFQHLLAFVFGSVWIFSNQPMVKLTIILFDQPDMAIQLKFFLDFVVCEQ